MKSALILVAAIGLCGCISTSTAMLDQRTAVISGRGSGFDSAAGVQHSTLIEAAETTIKGGFRYFAVVGAQDTTTYGTVIIPGQSQTTGNVSVYGNTATYQSQTQSSPATAIPVSRPGASMTIKMFREGEVDPHTSGVWDAQSVLAAQQ